MPAPDLRSMIDPTHTVLLLQECQKGVIGDRSSLPEMAAAAKISMIPNVARLADAARAAGVRVIHATAEHPADYFGANSNARLFQAALKSPVKLIEGTEAVEPLDEIGVKGNDLVLPRRHGLSPFEGTEIDSLLRNEGIRTVVLVGVSVNVAILNVAFDAVNRAYQVVIPRDAVAGTPADYVDAVLANTLGFIATITTTDDVAAAWA